MDFSATDAAFEGFRIVRRKPMVILWWSLAYLVFFVLLIAIAGGPLLALMPRLEAFSGAGNTPDLAMLGPLLGLYGVIFAVAFPLGVAFSAILSTAVARAVLVPEDGRYGYLRLGRDELRVGVVVLALSVLAVVAYMAAALLVTVFAVLGNLINVGVAILLGIVAFLAACAGLIWIAVRLSLAVPITFSEKRIAIFDSFAVTKGRFWPLLGMAVIATVMMLLVSLLGTIVGFPFQMMGGLAFDAALGTGDLQEVIAAIGPMIVVGFLLNMVLSSLQLAVLYAPFSAAYRDLRGV